MSSTTEKRPTPDPYSIDINDLPKIGADRIQWLYHLNYYDGPISGIAMVDGEPCYFDQSYETSGRRHRVYVVYKLTKEQFEAEQRRHALFQEHVGTHTDYTYVDGVPKRRLRNDEVKSPSNPDAFYKAKHEINDLSGAPAIGWFMDCEIRKSKCGSSETNALEASREMAIKRKAEKGQGISATEAQFLIDKIKVLRHRNHEIASKGQQQLSEERERFFLDAMRARLAREHADEFAQKHPSIVNGKPVKPSFLCQNDRTEIQAALTLYYEAAIENYELRHKKNSGFLGFFRKKK